MGSSDWRSSAWPLLGTAVGPLSTAAGVGRADLPPTTRARVQANREDAFLRKRRLEEFKRHSAQQESARLERLASYDEMLARDEGQERLSAAVRQRLALAQAEEEGWERVRVYLPCDGCRLEGCSHCEEARHSPRLVSASASEVPRALSLEEGSVQPCSRDADNDVIMGDGGASSHSGVEETSISHEPTVPGQRLDSLAVGHGQLDGWEVQGQEVDWLFEGGWGQYEPAYP